MARYWQSSYKLHFQQQAFITLEGHTAFLLQNRSSFNRLDKALVRVAPWTEPLHTKLVSNILNEKLKRVALHCLSIIVELLVMKIIYAG